LSPSAIVGSFTKELFEAIKLSGGGAFETLDGAKDLKALMDEPFSCTADAVASTQAQAEAEGDECRQPEAASNRVKY
jgi:hypothetical protein